MTSAFNQPGNPIAAIEQRLSALRHLDASLLSGETTYADLTQAIESESAGLRELIGSTLCLVRAGHFIVGQKSDQSRSAYYVYPTRYGTYSRIVGIAGKNSIRLMLGFNDSLLDDSPSGPDYFLATLQDVAITPLQPDGPEPLQPIDCNNFN